MVNHLKKWIILSAILLFYFNSIFISPVFAQTSGQGNVQINALVPVQEVPTGAVILIPETVPPKILEIGVTDISRNSVKISWKTDELCIPQINYGKTLTYEKTYIGASFSLENFILLEGLLAGTTYHFEIIAIDRAGNRTTSGDRIFKTLPSPDTNPPANISDFEAFPGDGKVILKWKNPSDLDFKAVKIIRSTEFYPTNPDGGNVVYNGKSNSFIDENLINEQRYYYTAFTYDESGNYSSGAVVSTVPFQGVPPEMPPEMPPEVPSEEVPPEIGKLTLEDFSFIQNGKEIALKEGKFELETKDNLLISIPYEKVPEVLKTIMITLKKGEKSFSFLLRVNKDKTFYEATIMSPETGVYPLILTILDYKNQTLKKIFSQLEVKTEARPLSTPWYKQIFSQSYIIYIILPIILVLIILIAISFIRKRNKKEYEFYT